MGNHIKKIVGLFVILCSFKAGAQLVNGSFEANCGTNNDIYDNCPTFSSNCIQNWFVTHGTPYLYTNVGYNSNSSVGMWSINSMGEGIALNFDQPLIQGHEYAICFVYWTDNPNSVSANLRVRLTNGLSHVIPTACGGNIPTAASQQVGNIDVSTTTSNWVKVSLNFIANTAYTQMSVYPFTTENIAVTVTVDDFKLLGQCTNTIIVDYTSPSVTESYEQFAVIRAGSHINGSSTANNVTVDQPGLVEFTAGQYVSLEDNFLAMPGANDEVFLAMIVPCTTDCRDAQARINTASFSPFPKNKDLDVMQELATIEVFPNPASDHITVRSDYGLKSAVLTDVSGRTIMTFQLTLNEKEQTLKLKDIKSGIYFLTITNSFGKVETKKLLVD